MPTIYDIAKKTGYSITTVSRALNDYPDVSAKTKKIILDAVKEIGYYPNSIARSLTTKKSWTLGVIFIEDLGVGIKHPFFSAVIQSFKQRVESSGYDIIFLSQNIGTEKKSYLDHALHRGVDGIIVVSSNYDNPEVQHLMDSEVPSVVIDLHSNKSSVVYSDSFSGSEMAVSHLYALGHRKIAHISGHQRTFAGIERLRGFKKAVETLNLDIPDSYIVEGGFFSYEDGYLGMKKLLDLKERPTAVYAAGDMMAIGAISAINESGLNVPADISVIGFDDIEIAKYTTPKLTTVRQDTDLIGENAAKVLLNQINDNSKVFSAVTIPVQLVTRESTREL
ncbi:LacI family DNA-binding transcriptional regulator [Anaerobacillus sp. CMMVII]|uniref:LacI family DNA-binding transcriptional regulator n=1 Tax=Anaerobacillus sp. CMMVII TaxID=2755588 RepID=UPI0021B82F41|nr:LacI family DNA-binding transcriptional regulator [Anaerobacillus sp. CMMVII]MCT8137043.1 LacI family DNA-binding transcriptional regulator [Anaerobacillus sp. CMMVII]